MTKYKVPITGWYCAVCFEYAQVMTQGETLCIKHAKEWNLGEGKTLRQMLDEALIKFKQQMK